MNEPILDYHRPPPRKLFAAGPMLLGVVFIALLLACLWVLGPPLVELVEDYDAPTPAVTRWFLALADFLSLRHYYWPALLAAPALVGLLQPLTRHPWRLALVRHGLVFLALLALFTASAYVLPFVAMAKHAPTRTPTGELRFANVRDLWAHIAKSASEPTGQSSLLRLAHASPDHGFTFAPYGTLHIIEFGLNRGAQGNGQYFAVLEDTAGTWTLVSDDSFGGNYYEFDPAARRITTSWHMSAAEAEVGVFEWNGHRLVETRHFSTDRSKAGPPAWRDFFSEFARKYKDD